MDESKRSSKPNAFFTGFGKSRRIVLYDTLIEKYTNDELLTTLAHEMGHYKLKHMPKMVIAAILETGLLFFTSLFSSITVNCSRHLKWKIYLFMPVFSFSAFSILLFLLSFQSL